MALEMIETIEKVKKIINYEGLNMRIGIHTVSFILLGDFLRWSNRDRYCKI